METIAFTLKGKSITAEYVNYGETGTNEIGTVEHTMRVERLIVDGVEVPTVTEAVRRKIASAIHRGQGFGNSNRVKLVIPGTRNNTKTPPTEAARIDLGKKLNKGNSTLAEIIEDKLPSGYL